MINLSLGETPLWKRALTSIKGIAILLVIYNHFWIYPFILDIADVAVDMFLIISGFTLTISQNQYDLKNLEINQKAHWFGWYEKRFIRIYPKFWIMSLIKTSVIFFLYGFWISFELIIVHMSGFQSSPLFPENFYLIDNPHWYISILLISYLIFPLLYRWTKKHLKACILGLAATYILAIVFASQIILFNQQFLLKIWGIDLSIEEYYLFFYRFFDAPLGILLAQLFGREPRRIIQFYSSSRPILVIIISTFVGFILYGIYRSFISFDYGESRLIYFPILSFCLFNLLMVIFIWLVKLNRLFGYFGKYSYELYLVHYMIYEIMLVRIMPICPFLWNYIYLLHIGILFFDLAISWLLYKIGATLESKIETSKRTRNYLQVILYAIFTFTCLYLGLFLFQVDIIPWNLWIFPVIFIGILGSIILLKYLQEKRKTTIHPQSHLD